MIKKSLHTLAAAFTLTLATAPVAHASFLDSADAQAFVQEMVENHGFERSQLNAALARAQHDPQVIRLITPPTTPAARSWQRYRARFLTDARIEGGVAFWHTHRATIEAASQRFGVPPEVIVSIIGVETNYGSYTGNFETVSALATLAFNYPPRAPLFRKELENLFLLAREQGRDPFSFTGSYAGAVGYPQFLPSSIRNYAVDFDGNGVIDFDSNPVDAIGSVANYLAVHGWRTGEPVAYRVIVPAATDPAPLIAAGIEPALSRDTLLDNGIVAIRGELYPAAATLVDLVTPNQPTEYWVGYRNFYVITRYNRSSFYAMSVFELAEALRRRYGAPAQ
ncbi:MAG: lytic murein transglycosylase B [Rhodocyclaceae bacterium]